MGKIIAVDGNWMCGKRTGMGTVAYNVVKQWRTTKDIRVVLYLPEELDEEYADTIRQHGIETKILGKANYIKWEQFLLPRALREDGVDVLWSPYNTAPLMVNARRVITINDVIYMTTPWQDVPTLYKKAGMLYRRIVVPKAAKKADKIITISHYAKQELCRLFPYVEDKIDVIYDSANKNTTALSAREQEVFFNQHGIRKTYILAFGSLEKRKNTLRVIKAYEQLPEEIKKSHQLILFGFRGYAGSEVERYLQVNGRNLDIKILGFVSEKEKNTLYQQCDFFVFPSLSEGFGIPVLEAYANQAAVITSNTTSLPEVAGDAAVLVNPESIESICSAMLYVLHWNDKEKLQHLKEANKQLTKFDWQKTADKLWQVMSSV